MRGPEGFYDNATHTGHFRSAKTRARKGHFAALHLWRRALTAPRGRGTYRVTFLIRRRLRAHKESQLCEFSKLNLGRDKLKIMSEPRREPPEYNQIKGRRIAGARGYFYREKYFQGNIYRFPW